MADVNANIGVQIDTSDALAQLKNLQRQLSQFHTSVAKSSSAAASAQKNLQKNLLGSINSIGAFTAELRTIKTSAESFTDSLEKNKFSMREYFRYAGASTKTFGRLFTSELDTVSKVAEDRVKKLQTQYIKLGRDTQGAMKAIAIMPNQLDFSKTSTQLQIAAQKQAIFNQLLKQGSTNLLNFGKNTQWAGRQLMVGFTVPLGILGMKASQTFMEMEKAAIKFKKVYGDLLTSPQETQAALDGITELAKQFTKYGVAVADTVSLSAEAAAAGFQGLDLQRQTTEATRLSVLGQIDVQQALETTIALQNAFQMSSENLAGSIDFLNAVENQTVTSLDDITTAIPKVAPIIQQLGGDVKDLAFFLTAMKEGGINASEGANALKSGLAALINPTSKATAMLEGMGININQIVEGNKGDLKATVVGFAKALDTLDPLARARAIEQMFGKFQFARLSTLFQNVTKDGTQASRVLKLAGTSIEDLAALSSKELGMTADSPMNKFKKAVEDLQLALVPVGETFLKAVTPIVEFFGNILEKFSGLSENTKKIITIITIAVAGVGPVLLMTFGLLANGIANILKLFGTLRNGYLKLSGQSTVLGEQTQYLSTEQLEAAAAAHSLNQSHATLKQTFDVEKASLDQLILSYQSAARASAAFAAANPGSMLPIRGGSKTKKYAKGKPYVVGGVGNRDSEPAMLAPGETVIPAAMSKRYGGLINGMIAGNIPGYRKGKGGEGDFAHITSKKGTTLGAILQELESLPDDVKKARRGLIDTVKDLVDTFGENVKAFKFSGLGFSQSKKLNIGMANGGAVDSSEFLKDFAGRGISKWEDSMSYAGVAMDEVADDLRAYDANIERLTRDFAKKNKTITSADFEGIEKEARMLVPAQSRLRKALDNAAAMVTEYRYNLNQSNVAAAGLTSESVASKKDPSKMSKKKVVTTKGGRKARLGGDHVFINVAGAFESDKPSDKAKKDAKEYKKNFEDGTEDPYMASRDRNSPHAQVEKDAKDDAEKYDKEFKKQSSQSRSSYRPQGPAPIGLEAPEGATMLPLMAPLTEAEKKKDRREKRKKAISNKAKSIGSKFSGRSAGIGLSSAAMLVSSMLPTKIGELVQKISIAAFAFSALKPMIMGLVAVIGAGPMALIAVAGLASFGIYKLNQSAEQAAKDIRDSAKREAEARFGSARAVTQFATNLGKALPSEREFSRNNRQSIAASGTEVDALAKEYASKGNVSTQIINQAALRGKEAGVSAVAMDVAQKAALLGLSPEEIAANIKAASDLIGADQVQVKLEVQKLLSPNGEDILKTPLTIKTRMEFLNKDTKKQIDSIKKTTIDVSKLGSVSKPKSIAQTLLRNTATSAALGGAAGSVVPGLGTGGGAVVGFGAGIVKSIPSILNASKANEEYKKSQVTIQSATVQLSVALMQQRESLALLNSQYADGLISLEDYEAQMLTSMGNFGNLEKSSKTLINELRKIDSTGELAAAAMEDMGTQALATLKKSNPALFDKIAKSFKGISDSAKINIYMGYAQGSLTIMDLALIPEILKKISGKTYEVALKIISESELSGGGKGNLTVPLAEAELKAAEAAAKKQTTVDKNTQKRLGKARQDLAKAKKLEADAMKVNQTGSLNTDGSGAAVGSTGTSGKSLTASERYLKILKAEIDALKKKRDAQKDFNNQLQRQIDLQIRQQDLSNKMKQAQISGDYLGAALIGQEQKKNMLDYNQESLDIKFEAMIAKLEERYSQIDDGSKLTAAEKAKLAKKKTGSISIPKLHSWNGPVPGKYGQELPAILKSKTEGVYQNSYISNLNKAADNAQNSSGTVYNIDMVINGGSSNANEIADQVIKKLSVIGAKNNKTNAGIR